MRTDAPVTGPNNQMLYDGVYRYAYDPEGNRIGRYIWTDIDENGQIDSGERSEITEYAWDNRNRLVPVWSKNSIPEQPATGSSRLRTVWPSDEPASASAWKVHESVLPVPVYGGRATALPGCLRSCVRAVLFPVDLDAVTATLPVEHNGYLLKEPLVLMCDANEDKQDHTPV